MIQPEDERSLVELARSGDSDAVGLLYERYFERIYRYIYLKVGDATEAEDLTEQVFLKMIEAIRTFKWQGSSFASWLYRIAHNLVIDMHRQHTRRPQMSIEPVRDILQAADSDPHRVAEQHDFWRQLHHAMTNLTDLQAQVIMLKFGAGLSNAQAAEVLERTEGAVKALQYSALQNLNKLLTKQGYEV